MGSVGRALGFYITYWHEMEALYPEYAPCTCDSQDMVESVGSRAGEQVAKLLAKCGTKIESHFGSLNGAHAKKKSQDRSVEYSWSIDIRLWPKGTRKSGLPRWLAGGWLTDGGEEMPYLWLYRWGRGAHGERHAGEEIESLLGNRVAWKRRTPDWQAGCVPFAKIALRPSASFDMQEEKILSEVDDKLKTIGKRDIERLFKI